MLKNSGKYDDIINLPHHVSKKHPRMSLEARSAQFAPFSALTGYEDLVEEKAKEILLEKEITTKIELNDGEFSATAWGCDLTYEYVKINGDYRT